MLRTLLPRCGVPWPSLSPPSLSQAEPPPQAAQLAPSAVTASAVGGSATEVWLAESLRRRAARRGARESRGGTHSGRFHHLRARMLPTTGGCFLYTYSSTTKCRSILSGDSLVDSDDKPVAASTNASRVQAPPSEHNVGSRMAAHAQKGAEKAGRVNARSSSRARTFRTRADLL